MKWLRELLEDLPINPRFMYGGSQVVFRCISDRKDEVRVADELWSNEVVYVDRDAFRDRESYFVRTEY